MSQDRIDYSPKIETQIGKASVCPECHSHPCAHDLEFAREEILKAKKVTHRWADYAFDECAYCQQHMGVFADTYEFNLHFMDCPSCKKTNMSGYIDGKFIWRQIPKVQFPAGSPSTAEIMGKDGTAGSKGVR